VIGDPGERQAVAPLGGENLGRDVVALHGDG
jgi:hypothetical protein